MSRGENLHRRSPKIHAILVKIDTDCHQPASTPASFHWRDGGWVSKSWCQLTPHFATVWHRRCVKLPHVAKISSVKIASCRPLCHWADTYTRFDTGSPLSVIISVSFATALCDRLTPSKWQVAIGVKNDLRQNTENSAKHRQTAWVSIAWSQRPLRRFAASIQKLFGTSITHCESVTHTDSQWVNRTTQENVIPVRLYTFLMI